MLCSISLTSRVRFRCPDSGLNCYNQFSCWGSQSSLSGWVHWALKSPVTTLGWGDPRRIHLKPQLTGKSRLNRKIYADLCNVIIHNYCVCSFWVLEFGKIYISSLVDFTCHFAVFINCFNKPYLCSLNYYM